jgi:FLVCR family feline leukemia virus subgroup C receptor-related protein
VVTLFAFAQMMTSIGMNTLNPIATLLSEIYDYSTFTINLGGLLYILMHPFFTFPAAYVIDSKGVKAGIIVGSVLSLAGVSLRLLIN